MLVPPPDSTRYVGQSHLNDSGGCGSERAESRFDGVIVGNNIEMIGIQIVDDEARRVASLWRCGPLNRNDRAQVEYLWPEALASSHFARGNHHVVTVFSAFRK